MRRRTSIFVSAVLVGVWWPVGIGGQPPWHVDAASALCVAVDPASVVGIAASGPFVDCNNNGIDDADDIANCAGGPACDDCNDNGIPDECDIADCPGDPACADCNGDGRPDECGVQGDCLAWVPTWPVPLNTNAASDSGYDSSPQLATDRQGNWLAVWLSHDDLGGTIGGDSDILFSRTMDNGASWSAPAPLNTNAASDSGSDDSPQLTTDGQGNWLGVWYSSDDLDETIGIDGDILFSRSTNNGVSWTAPAPYNNNAASDVGHDGYPQLITGGLGKWVAVWHSGDDLGATIGTDFDILVARYLDEDEDCNCNGTPDLCELAVNDCDGNGVPDDCDLAGGAGDCQANGILDVCEADCDGNGVPDDCDLASGAEDCQLNGILDACELAGNDCDANGVPDECDLAGGAEDCQLNAILDVCELVHNNCNDNGIPDDCDIADGTSDDDNGDGVPDECPPPLNDDCHIEEDPPDPNRRPTGAFAICAGDPDHPERGEWFYYEGNTPETSLGICWEWPGYPETPPDFGQVCHPLDQTSCTDPPNEPFGANPCFPWGLGLPEFRAYECYVDVDNRVASTDGPTAGGDCFGSGGNSFRADVWYTVTAPCHGKAIIDMCTAPAEYNSMLAVFGDHTHNPRCPSTGDDNLDLLYCNDDYCMGDETVSAVSWETVEDAVYLLRLGGYSATGTDADAARGLSRFHVGFYCIRQPLLPNPPALPDDPIHQVEKNRYISVNPNTNPHTRIVLKVEVAQMRRCQNASTRACLTDSDCDEVCDDVAGDPPYHTLKCPPYDCSTTWPPSTCIWSGPCVDLAPTFDPPLAWVVQQPIQDPTGGCKSPGCPPYPPGQDNCCEDDDWMAYLGTTVPELTGGYTFWSEVWADLPAGVLHITDCGIVPATTYAVYTCYEDDLDWCSEPLLLSTAKFPVNARPTAFPLYADVCGGTVLPGPTVLPPDGYVSVKDLLVENLTIINYGGLNLPQMHPTWADLHGSGSGIPPNYNLSVADLMAVYVFSLTDSKPYVNTQGGLDPQDCP